MKTIALRILIISAAISSHAVAQVAKQISSLPAIITKPGRYVLNKDLVLKKVAEAAITITVDDVKLDLGGHVISQTDAAGADVYGIHAPFRGGISVFNGTIRGFNIGIRINCYQSAATDLTMENLHVEACRTVGIQASGLSGTVRRCVVADTGKGGTNAAYGINLDLGFATVLDNTVTGTVGATGHSYGMFGSAQAGVIEGNRILNDANTHGEIGIRLGGGVSELVENNRICGFLTGIEFTPGAKAVYRNNLTTDCTTKYTLGTDAGNNK